MKYTFWGLVAANAAMGVILVVPDGSGHQVIASRSADVPKIDLLDAPPGGSVASSAVSGMGPRVNGHGCRASAPFADFRDALAFASRLEATGTRAELREAVARGRPDHVVYIEPAASQDAARRILREVEGQSIRGQVVDGSPLANAVTVGVFAERAEAEAMAARVRAFGYPVRRRALDRAHTVYVVLSHDGGAQETQGLPGTCDAVL